MEKESEQTGSNGKLGESVNERAWSKLSSSLIGVDGPLPTVEK